MDVTHVEFIAEQLRQIDILPSELRSIDDHTGLAVHHSGNYQADTIAERQRRTEPRLSQCLTCLPAERRGKLFGIELGRKAHDLTDLLADRVGDHHERSRRPNVEADRYPAIRIDVKECRLSARHTQTALSSLADQLLLQEFVH